MAGHDRFDRSRRGALTTWVPLVVTVTAAAIGAAAWVLAQHRGREDGDTPRDTPREQSPNGNASDLSDAENTDRHSRNASESEPGYRANESSEWGSRLSKMASPVGAMLDSAGRRVSAGVAAAGVAMGSALAAITEEERSRASSTEPPLSRDARAVAGNTSLPSAGTRPDSVMHDSMPHPGSGLPGGRRRTVAVVLSAEGLGHGDTSSSGGGGYVGHAVYASILSHVPRRVDFSTTKLFVLIYAPGLNQSGDVDSPSNPPPLSLSSSYSNICPPDQLETPNEGPRSPFSGQGQGSTSSAYQTLYDQAVALVQDKSMVMPFSTPKGFTYMLRHLEQELDIIYLQESLAGDDGTWVNTLQLWFKREIVLVVGAEAGGGGLADSDDSDGEMAGGNKDVWWKKPERVGRGRGVVVVEATRVGDDWTRRIQGME